MSLWLCTLSKGHGLTCRCTNRLGSHSPLFSFLDTARFLQVHVTDNQLPEANKRHREHCMLSPGDKQCFCSNLGRSCCPQKALLLHNPCHAQARSSLLLLPSNVVPTPVCKGPQKGNMGPARLAMTFQHPNTETRGTAPPRPALDAEPPTTKPQASIT